MEGGKITKLVGTILLLSWFFGACSSFNPEYPVPYVPTPMAVVDGMLDAAEVKTGDVLYDLGSGDGRIVIRAAKRYGVRGVGVERDSRLINLSRTNAKKEGVKHLVEFREQNALEVDVSPATVVTLYLSTQLNNKLKPGLRKMLKPGSRVVSHDFAIDGWSPQRVVKVPGGIIHRHTIYLWRVDEQPM